MASSPPATPTNTTQNINSVPEFLQPSVNTLVGAAEQQVYKMDASGAVSGMQPYVPYSTNGADYVAPLTSLQKTAQTSAAALKTPTQIAQGTGIAAAGANQSLGAGAQYNAQATDPNAVAQFMSPFMQDVVAQQQREANRQFDISGTQEMGAASQAGAFGGSREAIMASENERNRQMALAKIQAEGSQNAFQSAQQAQQFGANLGVTGAGQAIQGASTLGQLGATQLAAQQGIIGTQTQQGSIQQAQQQAAIDAAVANQQKAQAYPMEQLQQMSSILRGIPTQSSTNVYQAQPSMTSQVLGGIGTAASLYGAASKTPTAKKGGIVGYDVGGSVEADLYDMTPQQLRQVITEATSATERSMAKRVLAEKSMARGGIVAFQDGAEVPEPAETFGIAPQQPPPAAEPLPEPTPIPVPEEPPVAAVPPKRVNLRNPIKKHQFFNDLEDKNSLPSGTLSVVHQMESGSGKNLGPSKAGAKGHFQFMDSTAKQYGVKDPNNLAQSATGAAKYLGELTDKYGDIGLAAAAYNWGPANVDKWQQTGTGIKGQPMPRETVNYMDSVRTKLGLPATGIAGITRQDQPAQPAPEDQAPPEENGMAMMAAQGPAYEAAAAKGIPEILKEQAANRQAAGIGPDEATAQYRAELMAERANAPAERERQAYLRAAEFFAHWGSTPGPVIVAGLKALNETMPGYLADLKDQKTLKHALDKGIFDMNQADRLEQLGYFKEASAIKEKASDNLMKFHNIFAEATIKKEDEQAKLASAQKVAGIYADSRENVANIRGDANTTLKGMNPNQQAQIRKAANVATQQELKKNIDYMTADSAEKAAIEQRTYNKHLARLLPQSANSQEAPPVEDNIPGVPEGVPQGKFLGFEGA